MEANEFIQRYPELMQICPLINIDRLDAYYAINPLTKDMLMHRISSIVSIREKNRIPPSLALATLQYHSTHFIEDASILKELIAFYKSLNFHSLETGPTIFYFNFICYIEQHIDDVCLSEYLNDNINIMKMASNVNENISIENIVNCLVYSKKIGLKAVFKLISMVAILIASRYHMEFKYYDAKYIKATIDVAKRSKQSILEHIKQSKEKPINLPMALKYLYYVHSKALALRKFKVQHMQYFTQYELKIIECALGKNANFDFICNNLGSVYNHSDTYENNISITRKEVIEGSFLQAMEYYSKLESKHIASFQTLYKTPLPFNTVTQFVQEIKNTIKDEQVYIIVYYKIIQLLQDKTQMEVAYYELVKTLWQQRVFTRYADIII